MSADDILDAIARKHDRCAFIREITVTDDTALTVWRNDDTATLAEHPGTIVSRRIDALMLDGGGARTAIEVKISRADFARESDAKRDPWRRVTNRFVYATWLCGHGIHHYNRWRRMPYGVTYRACICGRLHPQDAGRLT